MPPIGWPQPPFCHSPRRNNDGKHVPAGQRARVGSDDSIEDDVCLNRVGLEPLVEIGAGRAELDAIARPFESERTQAVATWAVSNRVPRLPRAPAPQPC